MLPEPQQTASETSLLRAELQSYGRSFTLRLILQKLMNYGKLKEESGMLLYDVKVQRALISSQLYKEKSRT